MPPSIVVVQEMKEMGPGPAQQFRLLEYRQDTNTEGTDRPAHEGGRQQPLGMKGGGLTPVAAAALLLLLVVAVVWTSCPWRSAPSSSETGQRCWPPHLSGTARRLLPNPREEAALAHRSRND